MTDLDKCKGISNLLFYIDLVGGYFVEGAGVCNELLKFVGKVT